MNQLLFATNNRHKIDEINAAIGHLVQVIGLKDAGIHVDIPEPHPTLEQNATAKSSAIAVLTGRNCFSEDSGLEVPALNNEPGVRSARYAGDGGSSENNIDKVLQKLKGKPDRSARFRTVISLIWQNDQLLFEGVCEGSITEFRRGTSGFGYDSIFLPSGYTKSFGEMDLEEKNRISHRRKAADKLVLFLQQHGGTSGFIKPLLY